MVALRASAVVRALLLSACVGAPSVALAQEPMSVQDASRLLAQATFGANWEEIQRTANVGVEAWLDEQFEQPIGFRQPYLDERVNLGVEIENDTRREAWWKQIMEAPAPLRQRVAFAFSDLFVVSDSFGVLRDNPIGVANYYDQLLLNSFGNFRDLLRDVSLHPIMGTYLSHLRNVGLVALPREES